MFWLAATNPVFSPESAQARALSDMFEITLIVCAAILFIVTGITTWCVVRYRQTSAGVEPRQTAGNTKLEVSWTLASALVLIFLFALTVRAMRISDPPTERPADITVVGHQWWWEVHYANGAVTANEIHIPVQSDILVRVEASDVIHSFWVPQLGRKMDAIPGHPNNLWIRADKAGEYLGTCSEFCGAQHAGMHILVVAQLPEEFRDWNGRQLLPALPPENASALHGEQLFREMTCVKCHSIHGVNADTHVGPDLTHFAGRETIGAGMLQNNATDVRRWLANPQSIKPGCYMPNFNLAQTDVEDLAALLETLK